MCLWGLPYGYVKMRLDYGPNANEFVQGLAEGSDPHCTNYIRLCSFLRIRQLSLENNLVFNKLTLRKYDDKFSYIFYFKHLIKYKLY